MYRIVPSDVRSLHFPEVTPKEPEEVPEDLLYKVHLKFTNPPLGILLHFFLEDKKMIEVDLK